MKNLRSATRYFSWRHLRVRAFSCPACGPSLLLRLGSDEMLVRCLRCRGTPVHLSLISAIRRKAWPLDGSDAYEMSTTGAVLGFLRDKCRSVQTSELLDGVASGALVDGIRCEDVQQLTFPSDSFDLCTSTEVFEHVPDDLAGYRELRRVLKPGGFLLFTVPMTGEARTVTRARRVEGVVEHLLPPAYHGDRLTGAETVLVYRDYGTDIVERVAACGFSAVELWQPPNAFLGERRTVVCAQRDDSALSR